LSINDIELQKKREADAVQDGIERYFQSRRYQPASGSKPVRHVMGDALESFADAILAEQIALKQPQRQRPPKYAADLVSVDARKLALIALGTVFNAIGISQFKDGLPPGLTTLRSDIGQRCRLERIFDCLLGREVDVAYELHPRNRSRNAGKRAAELARKHADDDDWAKNFRAFHLGEKLIALAVAHARFNGQPIFELIDVRETDAQGTKTTQRITLTAAAEEWIAAHQPDVAALSTPVYQPMIVAPRPWTSLSGGGYLLTPLNLLKRQPTRRAQQLLAEAHLAVVFSAVDALQNTPFRINEYICRMMRRAWDGGYLFFGFKSHDLARLPLPLPDDADPQQIADRKRERAEAAELNQRIKGLKKVTPSRLCFAEGHIDRAQIYFPYQLDHRGRAYPVPQLVNPQSDDVGRSLLVFAEGKPLGERGAYWLAIHLANCYLKGKKVSNAERRAWVEQNEEEIIRFARNPIREHRFWKEADNPWLFLAACHEWEGYKEKGPGFISHLPVSMDGSCNGYQHLSALGRDPIGGRATNLMPGNEPEDIYQRVIDLADRRIEQDAKYPGPDQDAARQLRGRMTRDDAKGATMTTPYGVTRGRICKMLMEGELIKSCKDPKKCARYLAKVLEECIPEVAVEAGKIMKWLRQLARIVAKANRGMEWTTTTGFCVVHETREAKKHRLATADRTFVIEQEDETQGIDARGMADGIVAHLVHSLDATHMMRTICRLLAEGIRHFAMVHDSYAVHACDVDLLHRVIREEFVAIYSQPVLQNFLKELRKAHPDLNFPDPPRAGNLDIRQVLASPYFFA